jgi:hypothetical protein
MHEEMEHIKKHGKKHEKKAKDKEDKCKDLESHIHVNFYFLYFRNWKRNLNMLIINLKKLKLLLKLRKLK